MSFKFEGSAEVTKSELELFQLPGTQVSIQSGKWVEYHPLSTVGSEEPIEFNIGSSGDYYLDLGQTFLYVKAKVMKSDGEPLDATSGVVPVNLFLHSLFSQVDVWLNEKLVSHSSNTYPYRAYIDTLLNNGQDVKTSQLTAELFYKEANKRGEFIKLSQVVDMVGELHCDIFNQERLLLNMVDLKIKLVRSNPKFCLIGGKEEYKIVLDKVSLFVRKVQTNPGVIVGHAKALEKTTAKYPLTRLECKMYSIPKGSMSFSQDHIYVGQMPKKLVVGCVASEAFHGSYASDPFKFEHFNLNFVAVSVDGQSLPCNPLEPDFAKKNYIRAYQSLFLGQKENGLFISREEYADGNTLFAFDLTPDLCNGCHLNLIKHSNLRLELKFAETLEKPVCVILLGYFDNVLEINKTRHVTVDY